MTNLIKYATASALALSLAACASTATDDKYQVGVNDSDQYKVAATNTDVELSDEQTFGFDDDDEFETTVTTSTTTTVATAPTAVAGRVVMSDQTIFDGTATATNYSTVRSAIIANDLDDMLDGETEYTVFAPSNEAFTGLDLSGVSAAEQKALLAGHVVEGRISSADLAKKLDMKGGDITVTTAGGQDLRFFRMGDEIKVADETGYTYTIDNADMEFSNGYVHGINGVLGRSY